MTAKADLRKVHLEELEEEIHRRRRWREEHTPAPTPYCDECQHFVAFIGGAENVPDDYNPCDLHHKMKFRMPDGPTTDDWGFYRPGCTDRATNASSTR